MNPLRSHACREQAIQWVSSLGQRQFVGAESRLKLIFDLSREIVQGTEPDPVARLEALRPSGRRLTLRLPRSPKESCHSRAHPTARTLLQVVQMAYALLGDFRQVEQNFRDLTGK